MTARQEAPAALGVAGKLAAALAQITELGGVDGHATYGEEVSELRRYGRTVDLLCSVRESTSRIGRFFAQGIAQRLADEPPCPLLVVEQA